jgi:Tfp pilus assembly protein FimT
LKNAAEKEAMTDERGFSFLELVVLLAIGAIMMSISIPMVSSSMRSWQLAADARGIANTLAYAKLSATSQMTHYRISFDMGNQAWSLQKYNRSTNAFDLQGAVNPLSNGVAHSGIAFRSTSESAPYGFPTSSSAAITFNSRGVPIDGSSVPTPANVVYLSGTDADYAVTVSITGKVQLWKSRHGQWVSP